MEICVVVLQLLAGENNERERWRMADSRADNGSEWSKVLKVVYPWHYSFNNYE